MVFVQFKKSEKNSFVLEFPGHTLVAEVLAALIEINNVRIYLDRLIWSVEELANKGVLKPPQLQSVSWDDYEKHKQQFSHLPPEMLEYATKPDVQPPSKYVPDKNNQRYGLILPEEQKKVLLDAVAVGRAAMEPRKETSKKEEFLEAIETIRTAVMMTYPAYIGLPQWEPSLLLLEEKLELDVLETENFELYDMKSTLWWAGKELEKERALMEYAGKNEKTKIIVKVQKAGGEQPPREPPVDTETYKQMVKYYYKKVDEAKEFEKKSVESHYEKIETQSMKEKLHLADEVRYKPF